jgi:hypothetical protein
MTQAQSHTSVGSQMPLGKQLGSLADRSMPHEIARGVFVPDGPLTCPECGSVADWHDDEGRVGCANNHLWWDSNSPEYVEMYARLRERRPV